MSVEIFTHGDELKLELTIKDDSGTLTNPSTIAFTLHSPGIETDVTKTLADDPADITEVSTGVWKLVHTFDATYRGKMVYGRAVTTEPKTAVEFQFQIGKSKFS